MPISFEVLLQLLIFSVVCKNLMYCSRKFVCRQFSIEICVILFVSSLEIIIELKSSILSRSLAVWCLLVYLSVFFSFVNLPKYWISVEISCTIYQYCILMMEYGFILIKIAIMKFYWQLCEISVTLSMEFKFYFI